MSKSGIRESNSLLAAAQEAIVSIGSGSSNIPADGLLELHQELNECIDDLHKNARHCCPQLMKKLKWYRLLFKRKLEEQKNISSVFA